VWIGFSNPIPNELENSFYIQKKNLAAMRPVRETAYRRPTTPTLPELTTLMRWEAASLPALVRGF
jgi:hypothetical protein